MSECAIRPFYHPPTGTFSYLLVSGREAAVIDPVRDYVAASGRLHEDSVQQIVDALRADGLELKWILETHAHADHLSAGRWLREQCGGTLAIGRGICSVQAAFRTVFNLGDGFPVDGSQFDRLLDDGDELAFGEVTLRVIATPGHTSDSVTYLLDDAAFVGDTLFRPALGTARCDFPGGDAATLYASIQRLYELPSGTRLYLCHDYPGDGEQPVAEVSLAAQMAHNAHLTRATSLQEYVALREARDATLAMPALVIPAVQVNIRAGELPPAADNGVHYLVVPVNVL